MTHDEVPMNDDAPFTPDAGAVVDTVDNPVDTSTLPDLSGVQQFGIPLDETTGEPLAGAPALGTLEGEITPLDEATGTPSGDPAPFTLSETRPPLPVEVLILDEATGELQPAQVHTVGGPERHTTVLSAPAFFMPLVPQVNLGDAVVLALPVGTRAAHVVSAHSSGLVNLRVDLDPLRGDLSPVPSALYDAPTEYRLAGGVLPPDLDHRALMVGAVLYLHDVAHDDAGTPGTWRHIWEQPVTHD